MRIFLLIILAYLPLHITAADSVKTITKAKDTVSSIVIPNPNPGQIIFLETAEPLPKGWFGVKMPFPIPTTYVKLIGFTLDYQWKWLETEWFNYSVRVVDQNDTSTSLGLNAGWLGFKFPHNRFNLGPGRLYWASGFKIWYFNGQMAFDTITVPEKINKLILYTTGTYSWKFLRFHSQLMWQLKGKGADNHGNIFFTPGFDIELGRRVTIFWEYWYSSFSFSIGSEFSRILPESIPFEYDPKGQIVGAGCMGIRLRLWKGSYMDAGMIVGGASPQLPLLTFGMNWSKLSDVCCFF